MSATPDRFRGGYWDRYLDPRAIEFRDALVACEAVTKAELRILIPKLPSLIASRLERGPNPSRYECAVCDAFGRDWLKDARWGTDDPLVRVFLYHEVPKLDAKHNDDQHYGHVANRIYARCLDTYRCAGWTGVATPANA